MFLTKFSAKEKGFVKIKSVSCFIINCTNRFTNASGNKFFSSTKVQEFLCFVGVFDADCEAILLAWVTGQQNDDLLLSSRM